MPPCRWLGPLLTATVRESPSMAATAFCDAIRDTAANRTAITGVFQHVFKVLGPYDHVHAVLDDGDDAPPVVARCVPSACRKTVQTILQVRRRVRCRRSCRYIAWSVVDVQLIGQHAGTVVADDHAHALPDLNRVVPAGDLDDRVVAAAVPLLVQTHGDAFPVVLLTALSIWLPAMPPRMAPPAAVANLALPPRTWRRSTRPPRRRFRCRCWRYWPGS